MKTSIAMALALAASISTAGAELAKAATFSLVASADAFVASSTPAFNYGGAGAVQVAGTAATNNAANGSVSHGDVQTLLRFDTLSAKNFFDTQFNNGPWTITSITLQLGTNFGADGVQPNNAFFDTIHAGQFSISWLANDTWTEGTGNPNGSTTDGVAYNDLAGLISASDEALGTFNWIPTGNTNPPTIPPSTWSLSATSGFLADLNAGNQSSLRLFAADTTVSYLFNTKTFGTAANRPTLIITAEAVPEPTSLALLALGAATLTLRRGHRA